MGYFYEDDYLEHHGILGQKWGVRRFENKDGTLTPAGKSRYDTDGNGNYKKVSNVFSGKAAGYKALSKVYALNEKTYAKSNKTLSSMNKDAKEQALKKASEAQKVANKKAADKAKEKQAKSADKEKHKQSLKDVDPDLAKNKQTRRVALDYHNLDDRQFAGKYKTSKKTFAKRYVRTDGDTYTAGKRKAALALAYIGSKPAQSVYIGNGKWLQVTGAKAVTRSLAYDGASVLIGTNVGYKKAEEKYKANKGGK